MQKEACFYVGKIVRKYSFKGEVIIKIDKDTPDIITELESVLVALGENLVPFFMEKLSWQKLGQLRVKFEDIDSEKDADSIMNREIYLPNTLLPKRSGNDFYKAEIIDFQVEDVNYGSIGFIKGINEKTPQTLLEVIDKEGKLVLIPSDAFIKKIDRDNKLVIVETPEGLLDLRF